MNMILLKFLYCAPAEACVKRVQPLSSIAIYRPVAVLQAPGRKWIPVLSCPSNQASNAITPGVDSILKPG